MSDCVYYVNVSYFDIETDAEQKVLKKNAHNRSNVYWMHQRILAVCVNMNLPWFILSWNGVNCIRYSVKMFFFIVIGLCTIFQLNWMKTTKANNNANRDHIRQTLRRDIKESILYLYQSVGNEVRESTVYKRKNIPLYQPIVQLIKIVVTY